MPPSDPLPPGTPPPTSPDATAPPPATLGVTAPPPPGTPPPGAPPPAPVSEVVQRDVPQLAPVGDVVQRDVPQLAPVSEAMQRAAQGVELTKFLLTILSVSIVILVAYLWILDYKTSGKVDELYDRIFSSIQPSTSLEAAQITGAIVMFREFEQTPSLRFSADDVTETANSVRDIIARFQVRQSDASTLNQCVQLVGSRSNSPPATSGATATTATPGVAALPPATPGATTPPPAAPGATAMPPPAAPVRTPPPPATPGAATPPPATPSAASPPTTTPTAASVPSATPGAAAPPPATPSANAPPTPGTTAPPATSEDTHATVTNCIRILEALRDEAGGSIDLDRLRVMRDFTKDIHENHQSLRTFWISAAQLILVNVLLPLLTALLGYIFGRESTSRTPP